MSIAAITEITRGLTNRIEVCVINNINTYGFQYNRNDTRRRVSEKPRLPTLIVGEAGIIQSGTTSQSINYTNNNYGQNHYELIEKDKYSQVKQLIGYMGLKTANYKLYKVERKDTPVGISYINCGHSQPIDIDGTIYVPGTGSGGSKYEVQGPYSSISGSIKWEKLYQTARSIGETGSGIINWNIDVETNTTYLVKLRFADFWQSTETQNININGWTRRKNFSIIDRAGGPLKRTDIDFRIPVNNNKIEISLTGRGHLNAIEVFGLDKGDVELIETTRDDQIANKNMFLFVNKNIDISERNIKKKFLEIQDSILKSRHLFFF